MRAIVVREFGGPDVMHVEERPTPKPAPGEVLVRVHAAGVNPVDSYIRSGTYARKPALPYVPGSDGAGEVESVGAGVTGFKHGDRVYIASDNISALGPGTYAEYAICAPTQLHRLPPKVTYGQGAALGVPYATAYRSLFYRANARPGETVLVHGATGGVGIAAVQMGKMHGMRVLATGGSERGLDVVRENGADAVFNHKEDGYLQAIAAAAGSQGVDIVLEMAAHINLDKDLGLLAPQRPRRGHRQPRPRGDRRAPGHGARCRDSRDDAVQRQPRRSQRDPRGDRRGPGVRRAEPDRRT